MGYANGQIPADALVSVEGFLFDPGMATRLVPALAAARAAGGIVSINEGYRPLGSPPDQWVRDAAATSTGGSNQWFQWGRFQRGETPSAAYPGNSNHGWGKAGDADIQNRPAVVEAFRQYGLLFTISSEPWHFDDSGPILAALNQTPIRKRRTKVINYVKASTRGGNGVGVAGQTLCATAGMSPGTPANWIEYLRGTNYAGSGKEEEMARLYYNQFGTHIPLSDAEWNRLKGQFLSPVTTKS